MKKTTTILLMTLMLLAMAACGGREPSQPEPTPAPTLEVSTPQTSPEPTPAEPTASAEPAPGGGTVQSDARPELKPEIEAEIGIDDDLDLDAVPEDIAGIIRASAGKWMENIFEGTGTAEYECAELSLYDVDESSFCYSMACEFRPEGGEPTAELMAGNTVAMKDREGWYRFTRQIKVERDGDFWEITSVGTGGVSCGE